jgi:hypothetical protein
MENSVANKIIKQIRVTMTLNVKKTITKDALEKRIDETSPLAIYDTEMYTYSTENTEILE